MKLSTWEEALEKIKNANGQIFYSLDFTESVFVNTATKIKVKCLIRDHGYFFQTPMDLKHGHCCPKCGIEKRSNKKRRNKEKLIEECKEVHGDKYDYSLITESIKSKDNMKIICHVKDDFNEEHGIFEQRPDSHIGQKAGCPKCSYMNRNKSRRISFDEYISRVKEAHPNDDYDFSKVVFKDSLTKVKLICNKLDKQGNIHGEFEQMPFDTFDGHGCPTCFKLGASKLEKEVYNFVLKFCSDTKKGCRNIISPKELDIYIPSINLGIEFNGLYWHSEDNVGKNSHLIKTELCERKGIHLIQIFEDDWKNKRHIIESRLLNIFHKTTNTIYARKCSVHEVNRIDGKKFLEDNHLQGYGNFNVGFGLYYENELVSLMTFVNRKFRLGNSQIDEGDYELSRFVSKINFNIIGAADRLFKSFVRKYAPKKITSYADRFWTMNNGKTLYDKLGFKLDCITKPSYFYIVNGVRKHRFGFRKAKLINDGFDANMTEKAIMDSRGILRIWNSGNLRYQWKV